MVLLQLTVLSARVQPDATGSCRERSVPVAATVR